MRIKIRQHNNMQVFNLISIYLSTAYVYEKLTLLDLSGLFNAERAGVAIESQHDGTNSPSNSEELPSDISSSAESMKIRNIAHLE